MEKHNHYHSPEEKQRKISRINRIIGQLEHVRKMIEGDEDCTEVLVQLSATRSAIAGLGKQIISEHMDHCISHAIEDGDTQSIHDFQDAIQKFYQK